MTFPEHFRRHATLAYPVVLSQLGHIMVGVADNLMVGQIGAVPLAAASLANGLFSVVLVFGLGLTFGITPPVAQADGEDRLSHTSHLLRQGLLLSVAAGVVLCGVLWVATPGLRWLGQEPEVVDEAIPYLRVLLLSLFPLMIFSGYKQFAEGLSQTRQAMYVSVGANLLNIGLNYLLIFGHWGLPALGLFGAGVATLISRVLMGGLMALYVGRARVFRPYSLRGGQWSPQTLRELLRLGVPIGAQMVLEVGAFAVAAIVVGWFGAAALAAHQIAISLASVTYMMVSGVAAAATVRVGNFLGKRDWPNLRRAGQVSLLMAGGLMILSAVGFTLGRHLLPTLYVDDVAVQTLAAELIVIAAIFQLSDGLQAVCLGNLRGLSDVRVPTLLTAVAYWVVGLPLGYGLGHGLGMGAPGVWYGLLGGLTVAAALLIRRFFRLADRQTAEGAGLRAATE